MNLQEHELKSALWQKLYAHHEQELDLLRRKNDGALNPEQTQQLRGRIAQCKAFLALGNQEPDNEGETDKAAPTSTSESFGF